MYMHKEQLPIDVSRLDLDKAKQPITSFPFAGADADNLSRACLTNNVSLGSAFHCAGHDMTVSLSTGIRFV
jgi:hypothetical protein